MAYLVNIALRAERDLANLYEQIDAGNSGAALKWYRGLKRAVLSLEEQPERCPVTREDSKLRNLLYGRKPHVYRLIYRIRKNENQIDVLHIRHGAMRQFKASRLG
jgi:toxin ParE1/3/4